MGAANQQVAIGGLFEWLWLVADVACKQPAFAAMTDPRPARPPHRNIARLGKFEQALEPRVPVNDQATAGERDQRSRAGRSGRKVRGKTLGRVNHARCAGWSWSENLGMDTFPGDAPGGEAAGQIVQKRGRPTQIEVLYWLLRISVPISERKLLCGKP